MNLRLLPLALFAIQPAASTISLGAIDGKDQLAATTSEACIAAYVAPIDCENTILQLASSGRFTWSKEGNYLERTCTQTCKDSLDAYVQNVKESCTPPGDQVLLNDKTSKQPYAPVDTVGEVFRYTYAWACGRDEGKWCYYTYGYGKEYYASSEFPCTAVCSIKAMEAAHDYPGSSFLFKDHKSKKLSMQSPWWRELYVKGWDTVLKCRDGSLNLTNGDGEQTVMGNSSSESSSSTDTGGNDHTHASSGEL